MALKIVNVVLWAFYGIIALHDKNIRKFDYAITWLLLMLHLIVRCFEV